VARGLKVDVPCRGWGGAGPRRADDSQGAKGLPGGGGGLLWCDRRGVDLRPQASAGGDAGRQTPAAVLIRGFGRRGGVRIPVDRARRGAHAVQQDLRRGGQDDDPVAARHEFPCGGVEERPTAEGHNDGPQAGELPGGLLLPAAKAGLGVAGEQLGDGHAGAGSDVVVGIDERQAEALGQDPSHRRLA